VRAHPLFARSYVLLAGAAEHAGAAVERRRLLSGLAGRVLEVGAGHGPNFAHYPPGVVGVVALEPEPYLRSRAGRVAAGAPVRVVVTGGEAERLPFADGAFDAAVASLVLCSVADPATALAELRRVLRPGGELRFFEHVRASGAVRSRWQDALDHVWPLVAGGCHCNRPTVARVRAAGFELLELHERHLPPLPPIAHVADFVVGRARRG
jgi:SAM-dependent methyltransferase